MVPIHVFITEEEWEEKLMIEASLNLT